MRASDFLIEGIEYTVKGDWIEDMRSMGAVEFVNEKEFNTDLIYAVDAGGTRLKGTWSDYKGVGTAYKGGKGDGLRFEKSRRKFQQANLNETTTAGCVATVATGMGSTLTRNASIYGNPAKKKKKKKKSGKYKNSKDLD